MMANVVQVYRDWLDLRGVRRMSAYEGRTEVCLAMEGMIRMLREVEGTSLTALGKEEIVTALEGILRQVNGREHIERLYDELDEWRKIKFVEESEFALRDDEPSSGGGTPEDAALQTPEPLRPEDADPGTHSSTSPGGPAI